MVNTEIGKARMPRMKRNKTQLPGLLTLTLVIVQLLSACSDSTNTPTVGATPPASVAVAVTSPAQPTATTILAVPTATATPLPVAPEIKRVTPSAAQVGL